MIWGNFEKDRADLSAQYSEPHWDENSGMHAEDLRTACLQIERDTKEKSRMETKSLILDFILRNAQLDVDLRDFFPDMLNHDRLPFRIRGRWIQDLRRNELAEILKTHEAGQNGFSYTGNTDLSHCSPDWDAVMQLGFTGLLKRVQKAHAANSKTEEQEVFYTSTERVLIGSIAFVGRLADAVEAKGGGDEKAALIAKSLRNLTVGAPQNILEAMQLSMLFRMLQSALEGEAIRSVGGLDRLFYPFYKKDLENGTFTEAQIRELFRYYFWKFYSMKVTANMPFYLGGRLADGSSGINALSYLIVEEYAALDVDDPKIHIRWYDEIPQDFVSLVFTTIRNGRNSFMFINDNVVESALVSIGEDPCDARNYTVIGCYEPAALGKEIPCTCAGRANMVKALLTVMNGGLDSYTGERVGTVTADPDSYADFDAFFVAVKEQIAAFLKGSMDLIRAYESYYPTISQAPLLSSTFADCVERGVDAYAGGAKYNNSSVVAFSVANTVDGLTAVKKLVYEEKRYTVSELADILNRNWEGHEMLRREILKKHPKYGNGNPEVDHLAAELVDFAASCVNGQPNGRGGVFRLGLFSIDYRITFGERTGATIDGRRSGEMLSKNMGAVTAMDKEGITALIQSVTTIDYKKVPDGTVLDAMLHTSAVEGESGLCAMHALLKTYMECGGFAIQFNVLSPDVLYAAQREPEKYATLQVRLCGWNVYFTELSRAEQDELIKQCENASA